MSAIFDFLIGTIMGPQNEEQKAKGFIGFSGEYKAINEANNTM